MDSKVSMILRALPWLLTLGLAAFIIFGKSDSAYKELSKRMKIERDSLQLVAKNKAQDADSLGKEVARLNKQLLLFNENIDNNNRKINNITKYYEELFNSMLLNSNTESFRIFTRYTDSIPKGLHN